jgi:opacity protein-like surface antigen
MKRILSLTSAALLLLAASATAQSKAEIGIGGGITQPTGDFGDVAKLGWHGLATITVFPGSQPFALQGSAFYGQNKFDTGGGKTKLFGALGEFKLDLRTGASFTPYVVAGGGLVNVKTSVPGGTSSSDNKGALDAGVGAGYTGASKVGFFVEARYVNVFDSGPDLTFIPVTAGLRVSIH